MPPRVSRQTNPLYLKLNAPNRARVVNEMTSLDIKPFIEQIFKIETSLKQKSQSKNNKNNKNGKKYVTIENINETLDEIQENSVFKRLINDSNSVIYMLIGRITKDKLIAIKHFILLIKVIKAVINQSVIQRNYQGNNKGNYVRKPTNLITINEIKQMKNTAALGEILSNYHEAQKLSHNNQFVQNLKVTNTLRKKMTAIIDRIVELKKEQQQKQQEQQEQQERRSSFLKSPDTLKLPNAIFSSSTTKGGGKKVSKSTKKVRKHQGIYQRGSKKGKLKPGFKYSSKKTKTGLRVIVKVQK